MGNKLLHSNWGDDSVSYTEEELAHYKRTHRNRTILRVVIVVGLLVCAALVGHVASIIWPSIPCTQIGEYTCVEKLP